MSVVSAAPILSARRLGLRIGGATILEGVDLDVGEGEFVSVIGPNGAGKTTLFNLLSGLHRPTAGRVSLSGVDVTAEPPFRRAAAGLGRTFQTSTVFNGLTVLENARLAVQARRRGGAALWRRAAADHETVERAQAALAKVGLAGRARQPAGSLAHGDKRKLELGLLLAGEFRILLLDEPTAGMALEDVPAMMDVVRGLHRDEGRTVLMVEHRMEVVTGLSDRIAVMHHGELLTVGRPAAVMADERVQQAYLGEPL